MRNDFEKIQGGTPPSNFTQGGGGLKPPMKRFTPLIFQAYII